MDEQPQHTPSVLDRLLVESRKLGFAMASEPLTGSFLRTLAASKPGGSLAELGTGTGVGTAWLLAGMDPAARLVSVDNDPAVAGVARRHLTDDMRVEFRVEDAAVWLASQPPASFDLVFADAWVGKYSHLNDALRLLRRGGVYVVDDMLPQASWPPNHGPNVDRLVAELDAHRELVVTKMNWSTGIVVAVRVS